MDDARQHTPVNIEDEMRVSYLDYAMSVIIGRALPDVRDGLKPVHRRALYTMYELKNNWNSSYKKSARIVGDCMGKYHPHGDSAIYDTIVRMAQNFAMRHVLVDGQGNFGSVDGDPAAAMRYTEVRMSRIAHELLNDIEKDTVEFGPNYDDSSKEPLVLPSRLPNLLINGSSGIAVGMATNIPPHNLEEVVDGAIAVMRNPEITLPELMSIIPGPDFPTGGTIYGTRGIWEAYQSGRGVIRIRAVCDIEAMGTGGRERIVVTELPYQVNKARLLGKIATLVREKKLEGISDLRDESDRQGMRMVIELKRDAQARVVLNQLYKLTKLQASFGLNMLAIVHGEPRTLGIKEMLHHFIDHRRDVTLRRTRFELRKAEARAHILDGFIIALDNIDRIIQIIRGSQTVEVARQGLISEFGLSEIQSTEILNMRLRRLTGLERAEIEAELAELRTEIERLLAILGSEELLINLIEEELRTSQQQFANPRRTTIIQDATELSIEDLIPREDMVVTVSHEGYIKRVPVTEYNTQRRGGRGKQGMKTKETDFVEHLFVASTHAHMLFFTNTGRVFSERVFELPAGSRTARGKPIVNMLSLEDGEKLAMVRAFDEFVEGKFLLFATAKGQVKKTDLMAYSRIRSNGIHAIKLIDDDQLIAVRQTTGDSHVMLATRLGKTIRFDENDVRATGRQTGGVRGIRLEPGNEVVGCVTFDPAEVDEENTYLLTATVKGYGKRTKLIEYSRNVTNEDGTISHTVQKRGGNGVIDIKTSERNGVVVGVIKVESERDQYLMVTDAGVIIRARVDGIREISRNTQGVRLINLDDATKVVSIALYAEQSDENPEGEDAEGETPEGEAAEGEAIEATEAIE
jgi:DNA gyrase subunit A